MNKTTITTFAAIAAACFAGSSAFAGTPVRTVKPSKHVVPPPTSESCITGELGFDVTSEYIRHGIVIQNQGFQMQQNLDLHFRLYKGDGFLTSLSADLGLFSHIESHHANVPNSTTQLWRELDFYAGVTAKMDKFSISPFFKTYSAPNDVQENVYVLGVRLAYDDSDLLGDFALHPYVLSEIEGIFDDRGTLGNGQKNGHHYYVEVGIAPRHTYGDLTLTVPISAGFGARYYAGNKAFGYIAAGLDASYALNMVPDCLGKWSVHAGFTYEYLGEGARNSAPDRERNHYIASGGLRVAF